MSTKSEFYDEIMREYDQMRSLNQRKHEDLMAEIYEKLPEYKELERSIPEIVSSSMPRILSGDIRAKEDTQAAINNIDKRMKAILLSNGYPEDAAEPLYTCKDCKDTGYIAGKRCHCFTQKLLLRLYAQSNIGEVLNRENFDTLSYDYYTDSELELMTKYINTCKKFVEGFDKEYKNIVFLGKPGVGKTFLTNCIAKALLDSSHSVIYFTSNSLFDRFNDLIFGGRSAEAKDELNDDLFSCDLLIIDDLGTEIPSKMVASQFFNIINTRHLLQKSTIISTNLSLEEIRDRYSDRIISRLIGNYDFIIPKISDLRLKMRNVDL